MITNKITKELERKGYTVLDFESLMIEGVALTLLDDPEMTKAKPNKNGDCVACGSYDCSSCKHYNFR